MPSVQTAHKKYHNIPKVIHMTPVHQLMSCEVKSCVLVRISFFVFSFRVNKCIFMLITLSILCMYLLLPNSNPYTV